MNSDKKYLSDSVLILQFFGLFYFSVAKLNPENQKKFPSRKYTIYFAILLIILVGLSIYIFYLLFLASSNEDNSKILVKDKFLRSMIYISLLLVISVCLIQSFVSTPSTKKFFLNCVKITNISICDFGHFNDYRVIRRSFIKNVINYFIIFVFLPDIWSQLYNKFNNELLNFKTYLIFFLPILLMRMSILKFLLLVKIVNLQLDMIYNLIEEVFEPPKVHLNNPRSYIKTLKCNKSLEVQMRLKFINIRRIYNIIFENTELINQIMGITMITLFAIMVISITISGYNIILAAAGSEVSANLGCKKLRN